MPELPEVETSRRGIEPFLRHQTITGLVVRQNQLRWPISRSISNLTIGQVVKAVERRAKYLLIRVNKGAIVIHLGMSGSLRIVDNSTTLKAHDHIDLLLGNGKILRYNDPRRFGCWLWSEESPANKLLENLGPEPLESHFTSHYLINQCAKRKATIKQVIMDNKVVVGVGNIYATEALFKAGIHPKRAANRITKTRLEGLYKEIIEILQQAIAQGGTTLKDFVQSDGKPGYFSQQLSVYGKAGKNCPGCGNPLKSVLIAQRTTAYCPKCQT